MGGEKTTQGGRISLFEKGERGEEKGTSQQRGRLLSRRKKKGVRKVKKEKKLALPGEGKGKEGPLDLDQVLIYKGGVDGSPGMTEEGERGLIDGTSQKKKKCGGGKRGKKGYTFVKGKKKKVTPLKGNGFQKGEREDSEAAGILEKKKGVLTKWLTLTAKKRGSREGPLTGKKSECGEKGGKKNIFNTRGEKKEGPPKWGCPIKQKTSGHGASDVGREANLWNKRSAMYPYVFGGKKKGEKINGAKGVAQARNIRLCGKGRKKREKGNNSNPVGGGRVWRPKSFCNGLEVRVRRSLRGGGDVHYSPKRIHFTIGKKKKKSW